jgi:hypothetical protein
MMLERMRMERELAELGIGEQGTQKTAKAKAKKTPTGIDMLYALIPNKGKGLVHVIDTTVMLGMLFPDDAAAKTLAKAISASTSAKALAQSHGLWGLLALGDTSTGSTLDVAKAKTELQPRAKGPKLDSSMLDALASAPSAAPGAWTLSWFADLELQRMRARGLRGDLPPGAGDVTLDSKTSSISSVKLEVLFGIEGAKDLPDEKTTVLRAIDTLSKKVRAAKKSTAKARVAACMAGYTKSKPLRVILSKLKPNTVFGDPVTALVFTSDADATSGNASLRKPAMRLPQTVIAFAALDEVLAHELVHYHLMRESVGTDALFATAQPGLALAGPPRVQRLAEWLAYFHLAAQEEVFTFDLVASLYPPRPKVATEYEDFLTESRAAFNAIGATLTQQTTTIPGPKKKWTFGRDVPSALPTLKYSDVGPIARALAKFPRAKT